MYTVCRMQDRAGHFETLDTTETLEDAIASAKCEVSSLTSVYVFYGQMYPSLVAKVTVHNSRFTTNEIEVAYA